MKLGNNKDVLVGSRPVKVADANPRRRSLTIFAGTFDIWIGGNEDMTAGTVGAKAIAGGHFTTENQGEIWAVRMPGDETLCGVQPEFN